MRCGSKQHNNLEIPANATIHISPLGREYYISGIDSNDVTIRYVDDGSFKKLPYSEKIFV